MFIILSLLATSSFAAMCPGGITDDERMGFLNVHNQLRSQIAKGAYTAKGVTKPQAANMQAMNWDCSIEASAQKYANTCPTDHSHWPGLGENLYWSWSTQSISPVGIGAKSSNSWAAEFQTYGWNSVNYDSQFGIGHATQMAWATSNRLGCAYALCPSSNARFQYEIAVVCQYATPGNIRTYPIYTTGATCSQCPSGTTCNTSTGLCQGSGGAPPASNPSAPAPKPTTTTTPEYYYYYY